jgi:DNA mismatch endonuclease (patch repair protein)
MRKTHYSRDYRSPTPSSEVTSRVMSSIRGKNTQPEIIIRKMLFNNGFRGYRIHYKKIPGRPDIVFIKKKLAIFINGCFWHRCPYCRLPLPKSNIEFWKNKLNYNVKRDYSKIKDLEELGWKTLTIWECEIKKNPEKALDEIISYI